MMKSRWIEDDVSSALALSDLNCGSIRKKKKEEEV